MMEDGKLQKPVSFHAAIRPGEPIHLTASCEGISVQKEGTVAQPAQKRPLAEDDVVKQLKKTGGSFYGADDISVELDGDSFVPVSALNELRRETLDALTEKLQDRQKEHMFQNTAGKQKQRSPRPANRLRLQQLCRPFIMRIPSVRSQLNAMSLSCRQSRHLLRCARRAQIGCTFLRI